MSPHNILFYVLLLYQASEHGTIFRQTNIMLSTEDSTQSQAVWCSISYTILCSVTLHQVSGLRMIFRQLNIMLSTEESPQSGFVSPHY